MIVKKFKKKKGEGGDVVRGKTGKYVARERMPGNIFLGCSNGSGFSRDPLSAAFRMATVLTPREGDEWFTKWVSHKQNKLCSTKVLLVKPSPSPGKNKSTEETGIPMPPSPHTHTHTHTHGVVGAYPRGTGSNPVEGNGHFFSLIPSALSFVFLWHASSDSAEVLADAWCRGPADRSWSVSCMIVSRWSWRECLKCLFWLTQERPTLVV